MMGDESSPIEMQQNVRIETNLSSVMQKVFFMMTGGLVVTAIVSLITVNIPQFLLFVLDSWYVWAIAEILLVAFLSARIEKIGTGTGILAFVLYAAVNGVTLSTIYLAYTFSSIASVFFITAGMFGGAALVGKFTKMDLTKVGSYAIMALFGLIIAGIVNIFIQNDMVGFVTSIVGIVVFIALTAYDVQKIKSYAETIGEDNPEGSSKLVIMGALSLYLDFINIFLKLLRLMGKRRN